MAAESALLAGAGTLSLLDTGRNFGAPGIGLSQQSRALTAEFLGSSTALFSTLQSQISFDPIGDAQIQIEALRAGKSDRQLAPSLRGNTVDTEA